MSPSLVQRPALLVEAFAEGPCCGNGAAVVLLNEALGDACLQAIARSLNQSETAFLLWHQQRWCLRWFTPTCEVPLCGHATLAALLALGHWQHLAPEQELPLHTRSGPLFVRLEQAAPAQPAAGSLVLPSAGLLPAEPSPPLIRLLHERLGVSPLGYWGSGLGYRVALVPPHAPLQAMACLAAALQGPDRAGLVLMQALDTAPTGAGPRVLGLQADYQLRFFAPALGIAEDPVTGSAHALVAPWWMDQLGRSTVVGWQCSPRPGGMVLDSTLDSAGSSGMIRLRGTGHLLWSGTLQIQGDGSGRASWDALLTCA